MANILWVLVNDIDLSSEDTAEVTAEVTTQEGSTIHTIGTMNRTLSIKTLGLYNTVLQVNNKILDEAADYASDNGHGQTWTMRYLCGGFGSLA